VQRSFGDRRIVSASVDGSLLTVTLSVPHSTDIGAADTFENRSVFEAQVLGHAVADWMRAHGQQPLTTVRYRDTQGRSLRGWSLNGDPIGADPNVSPLAPEWIVVRDIDRFVAERARTLVWDHDALRPKDALHVATALDAGVEQFDTYDGDLDAGVEQFDTYDGDLIALSGQIGEPPLFIGNPNVPIPLF
jgi:hypothetical protein